MIEKKDYILCDGVKSHRDRILKSWVSDLGKTIFSYADIRSNAKAHFILISKRHCNTARELNQQEWDDMLTVMKDVACKIERLYKPAGYRFAIPIRKLGGQNKTHFYA